MAAQTSTEYIQHHLQNLVFGLHPENGLGIARSAAEAKAMGFWAIHLDTMLWSVGLGALSSVGVPQGGAHRDERGADPPFRISSRPSSSSSTTTSAGPLPEERPGRADRADPVRVDPADEHDGPRAGRLDPLARAPGRGPRT